VACEDRKKIEAFEGANRRNLAFDPEGNLAYLAESRWKLNLVAEQWPDIVFRKTRECQSP
jgi:peptide chain release factor 3